MSAPISLPPGPFAGYAPLPGGQDELLDGAGRLRPAWRALVDHISGLAPEDLAARCARGDEYLRDAGVYFRQYGESDQTERDWPLSHLPVLVDEADWTGISAGLIQRADLLESVMADLYGPARMVAEGHLPARLIADNPEWLRPMVGVAPRGGYFLNFLAFDIGRGPDGGWWVLGDRAQAPSGAGFALENRVATGRVFGEFYAQAHVPRLAGFFRDFRARLQALGGGEGARPAILTPGPLNDTYYEHAYIARYLGLMLLEGEDLIFADGRIMVRTVAGPRPVDVLWRRIDGAWADALELDEGSTLGAPGLVEALRRGNAAVINAPGSGVLETRALMAFLPRLSEVLRGEALTLPNIATWWCGDPAARDQVLARAAELTISPALSMRSSLEARADEAAPGWFRAPPGADLAERLRQDGHLLVGQEAVTLSTTPALVAGQVQPRPTTLRIFLARGPDGWRVMPGGYARIGRGSDLSALAMQRGGAVADVWVVSRRPVDSVTMLPAVSAPYVRPENGLLPARAADNLYWLGRYVERAEGAIRLLRSRQMRLAESGAGDSPLLAAADRHLAARGVDPDQPVPQMLLDQLGAASLAAGKVRDRFSVDGWMALADLDRSARRMAGTARAGEDAAAALSVLLRKITGFSGLIHDNMYRFTGWRFLTIGRALERAMGMAGLLADLADPAAPEGALDLAVEVGDSVLTHRRRYAISTRRETVIDLLALDDRNPRAILYQLSELRGQIALLTPDQPRPALNRAVTQLHDALASRRPEELSTVDLLQVGTDLARLSNLLSDSFLR